MSTSPWIRHVVQGRLEKKSSQDDLVGRRAQVIYLVRASRRMLLWDGEYALQVSLSPEALEELDRDPDELGITSRNLVGHFVAVGDLTVVPDLYTAPLGVVAAVSRVTPFCEREQRPPGPLPLVETWPQIQQHLSAGLGRALGVYCDVPPDVPADGQDHRLNLATRRDAPPPDIMSRVSGFSTMLAFDKDGIPDSIAKRKLPSYIPAQVPLPSAVVPSTAREASAACTTLAFPTFPSGIARRVYRGMPGSTPAVVGRPPMATVPHQQQRENMSVAANVHSNNPPRRDSASPSNALNSGRTNATSVGTRVAGATRPSPPVALSTLQDLQTPPTTGSQFSRALPVHTPARASLVNLPIPRPGSDANARNIAHLPPGNPSATVAAAGSSLPARTPTQSELLEASAHGGRVRAERAIYAGETPDHAHRSSVPNAPLESPAPLVSSPLVSSPLRAAVGSDVVSGCVVAKTSSGKGIQDDKLAEPASAVAFRGAAPPAAHGSSGTVDRAKGSGKSESPACATEEVGDVSDCVDIAHRESGSKGGPQVVQGNVFNAFENRDLEEGPMRASHSDSQSPVIRKPEHEAPARSWSNFRNAQLSTAEVPQRETGASAKLEVVGPTSPSYLETSDRGRESQSLARNGSRYATLSSSSKGSACPELTMEEIGGGSASQKSIGDDGMNDVGGRTMGESSAVGSQQDGGEAGAKDGDVNVVGHGNTGGSEAFGAGVPSSRPAEAAVPEGQEDMYQEAHLPNQDCLSSKAEASRDHGDEGVEPAENDVGSNSTISLDAEEIASVQKQIEADYVGRRGQVGPPLPTNRAHADFEGVDGQARPSLAVADTLGARDGHPYPGMSNLNAEHEVRSNRRPGAALGHGSPQSAPPARPVTMSAPENARSGVKVWKTARRAFAASLGHRSYNVGNGVEQDGKDDDNKDNDNDNDDDDDDDEDDDEGSPRQNRLPETQLPETEVASDDGVIKEAAFTKVDTDELKNDHEVVQGRLSEDRPSCGGAVVPVSQTPSMSSGLVDPKGPCSSPMGENVNEVGTQNAEFRPVPDVSESQTAGDGQEVALERVHASAAENSRKRALELSDLAAESVNPKRSRRLRSDRQNEGGSPSLNSDSAFPIEHSPPVDVGGGDVRTSVQTRESSGNRGEEKEVGGVADDTVSKLPVPETDILEGDSPVRRVYEQASRLMDSLSRLEKTRRSKPWDACLAPRSVMEAAANGVGDESELVIRWKTRRRHSLGSALQAIRRDDAKHAKNRLSLPSNMIQCQDATDRHVSDGDVPGLVNTPPTDLVGCRNIGMDEVPVSRSARGRAKVPESPKVPPSDPVEAAKPCRGRAGKKAKPRQTGSPYDWEVDSVERLLEKAYNGCVRDALASAANRTALAGKDHEHNGEAGFSCLAKKQSPETIKKSQYEVTSALWRSTVSEGDAALLKNVPEKDSDELSKADEAVITQVALYIADNLKNDLSRMRNEAG